MNWVARVIICGPRDMVPLVRNKKGIWAIPGGKWEPEDESSAQRTAVRETLEETGLILETIRFFCAGKGNHGPIFLFGAVVPSFDRLLTKSDDGEEVRLFKDTEIPRMRGFHPYHRYLLRQSGLLR